MIYLKKEEVTVTRFSKTSRRVGESFLRNDVSSLVEIKGIDRTSIKEGIKDMLNTKSDNIHIHINMFYDEAYYTQVEGGKEGYQDENGDYLVEYTFSFVKEDKETPIYLS